MSRVISLDGIRTARRPTRTRDNRLARSQARTVDSLTARSSAASETRRSLSPVLSAVLFRMRASSEWFSIARRSHTGSYDVQEMIEQISRSVVLGPPHNGDEAGLVAAPLALGHRVTLA